MSAVEILPNLWLGNIKASLNNDFLIKNNIKCIVNCTVNYQFNEKLPANIKKIRLPVSDTGTQEANDTMLQYIDKTVTFIYRSLLKGDCILVHCYAGKQRSPTIIASFIIKYCECNYEQALHALSVKWPFYPDHYIPALKTWSELQKN